MLVIILLGAVLTIFGGTVRENIAYGRLEAGDVRGRHRAGYASGAVMIAVAGHARKGGIMDLPEAEFRQAMDESALGLMRSAVTEAPVTLSGCWSCRPGAV